MFDEIVLNTYYKQHDSSAHIKLPEQFDFQALVVASILRGKEPPISIHKRV